MHPISYDRHRFPPEMIRHAIWLYARFSGTLFGFMPGSLSYRDVKELLAERGFDVSCGTFSTRTGQRRAQRRGTASRSQIRRLPCRSQPRCFRTSRRGAAPPQPVPASCGAERLGQVGPAPGWWSGRWPRAWCRPSTSGVWL
jgi:hypothetical protein